MKKFKYKILSAMLIIPFASSNALSMNNETNYIPLRKNGSLGEIKTLKDLSLNKSSLETYPSVNNNGPTITEIDL